MEMFTVINIAFALFLAVVILVNSRDHPCGIHPNAGGIPEGDGLRDPVCDPGTDGVSDLLAKFARSLFKKTAMGSFREEE